MGVQGLWDVIAKAGQSRSFAHLAVVDGFEGNVSGRRAYRVGIDASIWYNHASFSKGGENPELRLLFFRVRSLAELPLLPLFVFDGRNRPKVKRGSRMGKSGSHGLTEGMKTLLDVFGMEWRMAEGEAEAELAHLNRVGVIDAIMTDDVDALVFGALKIIRNPSLGLSGNKANPALNSEGKVSKHHVMVYTAEDVRNHPAVALTRGGLILFALLTGGDYDSGVDKFGKGIAHGLASCGFGDQLLSAYERRGQQDMRSFLIQWRAAINMELRTNSRGFLQHKHPSLSLPSTFPDMRILGNYACPVSSAQAGRGGGGPMRDNGDMSLPSIAGLCEAKFVEWGYQSAIIKRFRDLLWQAAVIRVLRRAALEADEREKEKRIAAGRNDWSVRGVLRPSRAEAVGTPASLVKKHLSKPDEDRFAAAFVNRGPSQIRRADVPDTHPLISRVVGFRQHVSTDSILEFRVEVDPTQLVVLTRSGIKGIRSEPFPDTHSATDELDNSMESAPKSANGTKKPHPDPKSALRLWIPACMMRQVHPGLVEDFEARERAKKAKKAGGKGEGKAEPLAPNEDESVNEMESSLAKSCPKPNRKTSKRAAGDICDLSTRVNEVCPESTSRIPLDPWFLATDENIARSSSDAGSGFLFSFPNPDVSTVLHSGDQTQVVVRGGDQDDQDDDKDDDHPNRFDILFDQIMGTSGRSSRRQKKTTSHRKRPRTSAPDPLNTDVDCGTAANKRRKKMHGVPSLPHSTLDSAPSRAHPCNWEPQPWLPGARDPGFIEIFSDSEAASGAKFVACVPVASSRNAKSSVSEQPRTATRVYPSPSSSQDSGLFFLEDAEVIIDLTS